MHTGAKHEPIERLRLWPEYLEVYEVDGRRQYVAVVERRNSRSLSPAVRRICEHLEDAKAASASAVLLGFDQN